MAVTTVDSGRKALEFLGLRDNDQTDTNTPSVSPHSNQVLFLIEFVFAPHEAYFSRSMK